MNKSESNFVPCGIEVSAQTLLVARGSKALRPFPNTPSGHQALLRFLEPAGGRVRVCLEATGYYGLDLALTLHQAGVAIMVANPRAVRHLASALMERSKTDPLDAQVLRQYAARMPFQSWQPPSPTTRKLVAVVRRLQALTEMIAAEKNRRHAASLSVALSGYVGLEIAGHLRVLEHHVERLTAAANELLADDPRLFERYQLLLSIPGFGPTSALHVLAELSLLAPDLDVRQWVAAAGLDPRHCDSGTSVHKPTRISKLGNARLRRALYMPALVASQHEPHLAAFYRELLGRGKAKMQALVALMRKLLHAIFGMFKHHQTYDGAKVRTLTPQPEALCA
jgi:transposase